MPRYVIADASVLIIFDKIGRMDILKGVYQVIFTTREIANEYHKPLPDWIRVDTVKDKKYQIFIETQVDIGEASAIALATEKDDSLLGKPGCKEQKNSGQNMTGVPLFF